MTVGAAARPATSSPPRAGRVEGLDGLRGLAILAVLVYHLRPASLPGGFLGVDVFFVVSGFLITTLLLRDLDERGRIDLRSFWGRRARRLLPALLAVVLITVPAAWAVSSDLLVGIGRQTLGALTFSSNWVEIAAGGSYFAQTSPQLFVNFWSLAVEEQFYLLWPVLLAAVVALCPPRARPVAALAVAGASALGMAALYTPGEDATRVYYGTDTHLFGLMIGAALAFGWAAPGGPLRSPAWRRWRGPAAGAALGVLVLLMLTLSEDVAFTFRGGMLLANLLAAVLVAALLGEASPVRRLMRLRPLAWVGQRSYGIYLWHWPIIVLLTTAVPVAHDSPAHWALRGVALALTLLTAAASYRWVETPVRRHGFRRTLRRAARAARRGLPARAAVAAVAVLAVATTAAVAAAPERSATQRVIEEQQRRLVQAAAEPAEEPTVEQDWSVPTGAEITVFGDSIVVTSADGLEAAFPGVMLDARSNRRWSDAEQVVGRRLAQGAVRRAVVLDFGTNAGVTDRAQVHRVLRELGEDRMVVVVNLYGTSHWIGEANATLEAVVSAYPNAVVADWHGAISQRPELLQSDQVHPGIEGAHLYADVVAQAFAELARRHGADVPADVGAAGTGAGAQDTGKTPAQPPGRPAADPPA